jgi:hypothetical protein
MGVGVRGEAAWGVPGLGSLVLRRPPPFLRCPLPLYIAPHSHSSPCAAAPLATPRFPSSHLPSAPPRFTSPPSPPPTPLCQADAARRALCAGIAPRTATASRRGRLHRLEGRGGGRRAWSWARAVPGPVPVAAGHGRWGLEGWGGNKGGMDKEARKVRGRGSRAVPVCESFTPGPRGCDTVCL